MIEFECVSFSYIYFISAKMRNRYLFPTRYIRELCIFGERDGAAQEDVVLARQARNQVRFCPGEEGEPG